ncbi:Uncharacterised protein [Mycobacteroides abscessus subsp. abscessus]|nr:Uncharacterised protein [Mycobacteroides abscessus subsp. abscessus]
MLMMQLQILKHNKIQWLSMKQTLVKSLTVTLLIHLTELKFLQQLQNLLWMRQVRFLDGK